MRYSIGLYLGVAACFLGVGSCTTEKESPSSGSGGTFRIEGQAQKGPFARGTAVRVGELNATLVPTGRGFDATILDDSGRFFLPEIELASPFVRLSANGFYFDEVAGVLSAAPLELLALAHIVDATSINVNVLSHLEKPRVEHLIGSGVAFAAAKQQAQREILAIFNIEAGDVGRSETLNISGSSTGDAALLAISAIVQSKHSVGEMSEILSYLSSDLREDGTLDSQMVRSTLLNEATLLDVAAVRQNLVTRYESIGISANIGDFESHVQHFKATSDFEFTKNIVYPPRGAFGENLLALNGGEIAPGDYSLAAELPEGTALRVKFATVSGAPWSVTGAGEGWAPSGFEPFGATPTQFSCLPSRLPGVCEEARPLAGEQVLTAVQAHVDISVSLSNTFPLSSASLEAYENGATTPSAVRVFRWTPPCSNHADCRVSSLHCEPETGACVPGCVPETCATLYRGGAKSRGYCDPDSGQCLDGCLQDADCVFGWYCDADRSCRRQTCTLDTDCPGDLFCQGEAPSGKCWCNEGDCPAGQTCDDGTGDCHF